MEKLIDSIRGDVRFKNLCTKIGKLKTLIDGIYNENEIRLLTELSSYYKDVCKSKAPKHILINDLLEGLLAVSGHHERLIVIKNELVSIRGKYRSILTRAENLIKERSDFHELKKQDRDLILEVLLERKFINIGDTIEDNIKSIEGILTYLDKLSFNIKSVVGYWKDYVIKNCNCQNSGESS